MCVLASVCSLAAQEGGYDGMGPCPLHGPKRSKGPGQGAMSSESVIRVGSAPKQRGSLDKELTHGTCGLSLCSFITFYLQFPDGNRSEGQLCSGERAFSVRIRYPP